MSTITHSGFSNQSGDAPYTLAVASPSGQGILHVIALLDGATTDTTVTPTGVWPTWTEMHRENRGDGVWVISFRGSGSPSAGTISTTASGGGFVEGYFACTWLDMIAGASTGAIGAFRVQSNDAAGMSDTPLVTLSAFASGSNAAYGIIVSPNRTITPGSGFTELAETNNAMNVGNYVATLWRNTADTTIDASLTGSDDWFIVGFEFGEAGGSPGNASADIGSVTPSAPNATATSARSVSLQLRNNAGGFLDTVSRRFWTRTSLDGAAYDGGAGGLAVTCNGSGVFNLTNLTVLAGAGWLTYKDPVDDLNCHTVPVTFV